MERIKPALGELGPTSYSEGPTSYSEGPTSYSEGPTSYSKGPTSDNITVCFLDYIDDNKMKQEIKYIVTADDLIGDIKIFPIEVVQKMVDYQVKQGNAPDVITFQRNCFMSRVYGGFDWDETNEGADFWSKVIDNNNFNLFFEKYPKKYTADDPGPKGKEGVDGSNDYGCAGVFLPKKGEYVLVSQDGYFWRKRIFLFENDNIYYCLGEEDEERFNEPGIKFNLSVNGWKFCKPIEKHVKLTIENPKGKNIYYINEQQFKLIQNIINNKN